jgi:hypothetical protein
MIKYIGVFLLGVYIGQEYGNDIPNVNKKAKELTVILKNTEIYNMLSRDLNKISDEKETGKKGWF